MKEDFKPYEDLDYEDIFHLVGEYSNYVQEFPENHDENSWPVSVYEFYENEYQEILNEHE